MQRARRQLRDQAGETLAEVLVAVAILGIAVTALLGGIAASSVGSDVHRKQASAEVALRAYVEAVERATFDPNCATAASASYTPATLGITTTTYPGFVPAAPTVTAQSPGTCATLQLITLKVVTTRTTLTVSVVKAAA